MDKDKVYRLAAFAVLCGLFGALAIAKLIPWQLAAGLAALCSPSPVPLLLRFLGLALPADPGSAERAATGGVATAGGQERVSRRVSRHPAGH